MIRNPVGICWHLSSRAQCSSSILGLADTTDTRRRNQDLKRVDRELFRGNEKGALKIVKRLQKKPDGLRGFGVAAKQVSLFKKQSLDLVDANHGANNISFHHVNTTSTVDSVLDLVMKIIRLALEGKPFPEMMSRDSEVSWETRHFNCALHEAGHFLVAYLLGVLPRGYQVPSIKDYTEAKPGAFAFVQLVDFPSPFEGDNSTNAVSKNLNKFSCIALGGILATYPDDVNEEFHSDIFKVYSSVEWMGFTDTETETYMRGVIQNTHQILERHRVAAQKLANAMANGRSVGYCIAVIEDHLS